MEIGDWKQLDFHDVGSFYIFACSMLYMSDHPELGFDYLKFPDIQVPDINGYSKKFEAGEEPYHLPKDEREITYLGRWKLPKELGGVSELEDETDSKSDTEKV